VKPLAFLAGALLLWSCPSLHAADTDALVAALQAEMGKRAVANPVAVVQQQATAACETQAKADSEAIGPATSPDGSLQQFTTGGGDPEQELTSVLEHLGLATGLSEHHGQVLLITRSAAQVNGAPGSPTWADARVIAFQTAEVQARAELVRVLASEVLAGRALTAIEESGVITDPAEPKPLSSDKIAQKAATADEATLDAELRKLGVPPEQYQNQPIEKKRVVFSQAYEGHVRILASRAMSGIATLAVTEGPSAGNQRICVAVVWSEQLAKLSTLFSTYGSLLPPRSDAVGKALKDQIPTDANRLARCFGVQRCVDPSGETMLVAYGQAGLANVPAAMRGNALTNAYDKAGLEARAMLKAFIFEQTSTEAQRDLAQLAAVVQGEKTGTQTVDIQQVQRYRSTIRSGGDKVELVGVSEIRRWNATIDGSPAAGVVLWWSPRTMRLAQRAAAVNAQVGAIQGTGTSSTGAAVGTGSTGTSTVMDPR